MKRDVKVYILKCLDKEQLLTTHHFSTFYEGFCNLTDRASLSDISKNQSSLRYYLNKLVKEGILSKSVVGTGYYGKTDWCHTHNTVWHKIDLFDNYNMQISDRTVPN